MRDGEEFRRTVRRGVSASSPSVVVHVGHSDDPGVQIGMVVGKKVGDAVTRNRVKRRLRHAVRTELGGLAEGTRVVVRALPAAAARRELADDVRGCLRRASRRAGA